MRESCELSTVQLTLTYLSQLSAQGPLTTVSLMCADRELYLLLTDIVGDVNFYIHIYIQVCDGFLAI